jgi:hypothetical protein
MPMDGAMAPGRGQVNMRRIQMERLGSGVMGSLLAGGYNFDLCDDQFLAQARREKDGLVLGGNAYRVVILPAVEFMPVATVRLLEKFSAQGGIVIAVQRWPDKAPGWLAGGPDHASIRDAFLRMVENPSASRVRCVARDEKVGSALQEMLAPDLRWTPEEGRLHIGFVHRETAEADLYFVVNTGNRPMSGTVSFRTSRLCAPQLWDAVTGHIHEGPAGGAGVGRAPSIPVEFGAL